MVYYCLLREIELLVLSCVFFFKEPAPTEFYTGWSLAALGVFKRQFWCCCWASRRFALTKVCVGVCFPSAWVAGRVWPGLLGVRLASVGRGLRDLLWALVRSGPASYTHLTPADDLLCVALGGPRLI